MTKVVCLAILLSASGVLSVLGQLDNSVVAYTGFVENVEAKRAEVQIGLSAPGTVTEIEAKSDGQSLPAQYWPFGAHDDDNAAILFLIDKSNPKRARTVEAAKTLTMRMVERAGKRTACAVYAFDANLALVADFGAAPLQVAAGLKNVKAVGMATELYRNAIEAIALLEKMPAKRRALMIISDGKAEDTTYTLEQTVAAASKAVVNIYSVGYAENPESTIYLQSLRRLATETGGAFAEADMRTRLVSDEFQKAVFWRLQSGGYAWIDLSGKSVSQFELTIRMEAHQPYHIPFVLLKLAPPALAPTPVPTPDESKVNEVQGRVEAMAKQMAEVSKQVAAVPTKVEEVAKKTEEARKAEEAARAEEASKQAKLAAAKAQAAEEFRARKQKRNQILLATFGGLVMALVIGFLIYKRRENALAAIALANAPVFARLQVLDGDGTEYPMRTTALRVGRGSDNDLALKNDSVSRHHAEIHRTRDGVFTITELNAGNGVLVNGAPVEKATLKSEDVIELGEVRIRFLIGEQENDGAGTMAS